MKNAAFYSTKPVYIVLITIILFFLLFIPNTVYSCSSDSDCNDESVSCSQCWSDGICPTGSCCKKKGKCSNGVCTSSSPGSSSSCGGSCFTAETKIELPDGSEKNIEDIKVGDEIIGCNEVTGECGPTVVSEIETPGREGYYEINNTLRLTDEHPLYIKKKDGTIGWGAVDPDSAEVDHRLKDIDIEVVLLEIGDSIKKFDGSWEEVKTIEHIAASTQTYNLVGLEPFNTYFADGYLAHNKGEKCGDGKVNRDPEECDDGNDTNNDACTNECKINPCPTDLQFTCMPDGVTGVISWKSTGANTGDRTYIVRPNHNANAEGPFTLGIPSQCYNPGACEGAGCDIDWVCVTEDGYNNYNVRCNPPNDPSHNNPTGYCNDHYIGSNHPYYNGFDSNTGRYSVTMTNMVHGGYATDIEDIASYGLEVTCARPAFPDILQCGNDPCTNRPTLTQPADQITRLSAYNPINFQWNYIPNNHEFCSPQQYTLMVAKKPDNNLADKSNCFDGTTPITTFSGINGTSKTLTPSEMGNLDWGTSYCWKAVTNFTHIRNANSRDSNDGIDPISSTEVRTFKTNRPPNLLRSGIQYGGDNPPTSIVPVGGVVDVSLPVQCSTAVDPACTNPVAGNDTQNGALIGGENCWVGGSGTSTHNAVTFWFEYNDDDNWDNPWNNSKVEEYGRFSFIINQNDWSGSDLSYGNNTQKQNMAFKIPDLSTIQNNDPFQQMQRGINSPKGTSVFARKYVDSANNNRVRIQVRVQFNNDFEPSGKYFVYAIMEDKVLDPLSASSNYLDDNPISSEPQRWLTKVGQWMVDTRTPVGLIDPPNIQTSNSFDVNWRVSDTHSGPGDFDAECYTDDGNSFPMLFEGYIPPGQPVGESVTINGNTNTRCFGSNAESIENQLSLNSGSMISRHSLDNPDNYDSLVLRINRPKDKACNVGGATESPQILNDKWFTTHQGTTYSEASVNQTMPNAILQGVNTLYTQPDISGAFYSEFDNEIIDLSTNFLGSGSSNNYNESTIDEKIDTYIDLNSKPKDNNSWYEFFEEKLQSKGKIIQVVEGKTTITGRFSDNLPCAENSECYVRLPGNSITINGNAQCNVKAVIFLDAGSQLTIDGDLRNSNPSNGCIFISGGNVQITDSNAQKDSSAPNPPMNTSPYDLVEGFFIIGGNFTIGSDEQLLTGNQLFTDGLMLNGGVVSGGSFTSNRDLGLRNNIQPGSFMMYDSRYMHIDEFKNAFNILELKIREK